MQVMIFSHAHPQFSKGGAEIAAYNLHLGLKAPGEHNSVFVARADAALIPGDAGMAQVAADEFLVASNAGIHTLFSEVRVGADNALDDLIATFKPDVIHFHHYWMLGVDLLTHVKRKAPKAKIFVTFHEFIAICLNNGQMVKTNGKLCHQYSPRECSQCFPGIAPDQFFAREQYIKRCFSVVDRFVSPSQFLKDRYVQWGIPAEKILVLENGLPAGDRLPPRPIDPTSGKRNRFAYFGQITPYKGVDVVLKAFDALPKDAKKEVSLHIYGSGLETLEKAVREPIEALIEKNAKFIKFHGAYDSTELPVLMADIDWVIMGSVWWENSPIVIQEAFKFGRPILTPDIGGMAEKVKPGEGGYNFRARDDVSLRELLLKLMRNPLLFDDAVQKMPRFMDIVSHVHLLLSQYQS